MSAFIFTKAIIEVSPIPVFNDGKMSRDFTYIDDIIDGIERVIDINDSHKVRSMQHQVYNIGNNNRVELMDYIEALETSLGKKAEKELLPLQPGDVLDTYADVDDLVEQFGYKPNMSVKQGVENFAVWYQEYNNLK